MGGPPRGASDRGVVGRGASGRGGFAHDASGRGGSAHDALGRGGLAHDALDQLAGPAGELLDRVDRLLTAAGAPDGHRIWPLLRQLRALPGDVLRAVLACRPGPLLAAASTARTACRAYDEARAVLADGGSWQGAAAEAYAARRRSLATYLGEGPEGLAGRMGATAGYAEAVADWIGRTRTALARTLADVLGSAEAVAVVTTRDAEPNAVVPAAAEIGARVLATVAEAYDAAEALPRRWAPELVEAVHRPSDGADPPLGPGAGPVVV
ncbi:hypothetical protein [Micromonospora sp. HM5-17]|uniref:hypothetical protein n=1 Tax=Micromonospora sp. HM5-17 TaxID=2487710 RepID=UPI001F3BC29E|nr:hypothetical protein [Micromonospora sp. HM5-17]